MESTQGNNASGAQSNPQPATGTTGDEGVTVTGTGLGLALVRQIARQHGGDAHLVTAASGGTCIEVRLAGG